MPDIVSSASPDTLPTIAEEAGAPEELTPEREAEIREWRDELGSGTSFLNVGPYCALHDALGEIDRLRAEVSAVRKERDGAQELAGQMRAARDVVAQLHRDADSRLDAVLDLCDREQRKAMGWENPIPVPEWVTVVQRAALGDDARRTGGAR